MGAPEKKRALISPLLVRCTLGKGVISRVSVSLIICTGGAYRPLRHDRNFSAASNFQIGVFRGRRRGCATGGRGAVVRVDTRQAARAR